jgi:hypothetical protein
LIQLFEWTQDREITDKLVIKHIFTLETHKFQSTDDIRGNQIRIHITKEQTKEQYYKKFYLISPEMEKNKRKKR